MIPNVINIAVGLALLYAVILDPNWAYHRYLPFAVFSVIILVMAVWARRSDARRWFSSVNIVLAVALGVLSLWPLATVPIVAFWGGLWVGCIVPVLAFWAILYRPKPLASR